MTIIATDTLSGIPCRQLINSKGLGISARGNQYFHTIKPIDEEAIITAACETKAIVTTEERIR